MYVYLTEYFSLSLSPCVFVFVYVYVHVNSVRPPVRGCPATDRTHGNYLHGLRFSDGGIASGPTQPAHWYVVCILMASGAMHEVVLVYVYYKVRVMLICEVLC